MITELLEDAVQTLENLAQAIRDRDLKKFDELTYDTEGAYCHGQGLAVDINLLEVRNFIEKGN